MIKIVINGRFLTQRYTGVQNFSLSYTKKLFDIYKDKLIVLLPKSAKINKNIKFSFPIKSIGINSGHLWEQLDLPLYLNYLNSPLLINLGNSAPIYYSNKIVTIHDLSIYVNKGWHNIFYRLFYKFLIPKIILNSYKVITVSKFSKKEIIKKFKKIKNKIIIVPNTVIKQKSHIEHYISKDSYFLFVGSLNKRKNLSTLIQAIKLIKNQQISLKIVGVEKEMFYKKFGHCTNVYPLGNIFGDDLSKLYKNSNGLIFPSQYEGFGIPLIESMLHKCPVLCSDIEVFKEICHDAAIYFNQNDSNDIKDKILFVYKNDEIMKTLIDKSSKRVREYYMDEKYKTTNQKTYYVTTNGWDLSEDDFDEQYFKFSY